MVFDNFRKRLGRSLAALVLGMAAMLPAQAILVVGEWDPTYGSPFTNLGWRGTTTLDVDASCLATPGIITNDGLSCPLMSVFSATVEFYDITNPVPTIDTLNFTGLVNLAYLAVGPGGTPLGFGLTPAGYVLSTTPLALVGGEQASFALQIDYNPGRTGSPTLATLFWQTDSGNGRNDVDFPAPVHVRLLTDPGAVPEPGTLALSLAALVGLGALARRRARRAQA